MRSNPGPTVEPKSIDRRQFLAGAACLIAAQPSEALAMGNAAKGFFASHNLPIGLQLYTLGDAVRENLDAALQQVASLGYRTVEMGDFSVPAKDVAQSLARAGLRCPSIQLNPLANVDKIAADAETVGFRHVTTSLIEFPDGFARTSNENMADFIVRATTAMTDDDWKRAAAKLNQAGKQLQARGLRFGYHNHNHEFAPRANGTTGFDLLLSETDPAFVTFELDVGWLATAGRDPLQFLRSNLERFELMHVKDIDRATKTNFAFQQVAADVGAGTLDWASILPAAYNAGIRQFFVEREPPFPQGRVEAARRSFDYLQNLRI